MLSFLVFLIDLYLIAQFTRYNRVNKYNHYFLETLSQSEFKIITFIEQERIYVVLPQGIDDGEILTIPEKGHCYSDVKGDIKLRIHIVAHPMFERRGLNLVYHQKITFKESICGFEGILQHVDGTSLRLVSSKGNIIQNGEKIIENH